MQLRVKLVFSCMCSGILIMMSTPIKKCARAAANALPVYRVYRGYKTAESLKAEMFDPSDRTWEFARRTAFDGSTDVIDGLLARYAGATRLGGYLDQLADKAWFLQIAKQLAANGEISEAHYQIPAVRDLGTLALRPIAQYYGLASDAEASGKVKLWVQASAVISACSPIASSHPEFVQGLFSAASIASVGSGTEMLYSYAQDISSQYREQPLAQLITSSLTSLEPVFQAA